MGASFGRLPSQFVISNIWNAKMILYGKQRYCLLLAAYRSLKLGGIYGRSSIRAMVIYEGSEEVLATAYYLLPGAAWQSYCVHIGVCGRAVHLHPLLNSKQ
jgi:hypothetical protein